MHLKDTKLGDVVTVYLGSDGNLCKKIGASNKEFPLKATIVGSAYHSLYGVSHVMLAFADTVSFVPNKVVKDIAPHNTPGYTFMKDFNKTYRWTIWEESDMECSAVCNTTAAAPIVYPFDQCKCGIHLTLNRCEYHSVQ